MKKEPNLETQGFKGQDALYQDALYQGFKGINALYFI